MNSNINKNVDLECMEYLSAKHPAYLKMLLIEVENKVNSLVKEKKVKIYQRDELALEELNRLMVVSKFKKELYN